jgi:hypothetical protein
MVRRRVDCFLDGHPGYGDWLAEYPLGYVSPIADTMTLPSCIVLIALTYRLCARNVRNRGSVKRGVHPSDERLKSGRPGKPISETFGAAARVSKQAAFSPCIQPDDWQS